jgi:Tol biopolymer transport system component
VIDVATGHERPLTTRGWDYVSAIAWPRGSRKLLVAGSEHNKLTSQLWRVDADTGAISRLTNDLNDYRDVDIAAGAAAAVTILRDSSSTLLTGTPGDLRAATEGSGRYDGQDALAWTPDGKLIFSATANGQLDLWIADADGTNARAITADPAVEGHVCVPPIGETVVYASTKNGRTGIWRQHLRSGQLTLLSEDPTDGSPVCSPDGRSVYFTRRSDEPFRVGLDGGAPQPLASGKLFFGLWGITNDSRSILTAAHAPGGWQVALQPVDGGQQSRRYDILNVPFVIQASPRGDALTYIESRQDVPGLWNQPLDGGPPSKLLDLRGERIFNFAWSRDGRLAIAHGKSPTDVVLLSGIR